MVSYQSRALAFSWNVLSIITVCVRSCLQSHKKCIIFYWPWWVVKTARNSCIFPKRCGRLHHTSHVCKELPCLNHGLIRKRSFILGPLHMSPVNPAGSVSEISPRHSFLCKKYRCVHMYSHLIKLFRILLKWEYIRDQNYTILAAIWWKQSYFAWNFSSRSPGWSVHMRKFLSRPLIWTHRYFLQRKEWRGEISETGLTNVTQIW